MAQPMLDIEREAEQIVVKFLDEGMVPDTIRNEVSALVENEQPMRALEMVLDSRRRS
jgi:hypothetical protein